MGVNRGSIDSMVHGHYIIAFGAEVVEWQTRTFEGRVGKPVRVQIPPSAPFPSTGTLIVNRYSLYVHEGQDSTTPACSPIMNFPND